MFVASSMSLVLCSLNYAHGALVQRTRGATPSLPRTFLHSEQAQLLRLSHWYSSIYGCSTLEAAKDCQGGRMPEKEAARLLRMPDAETGQEHQEENINLADVECPEDLGTAFSWSREHAHRATHATLRVKSTIQRRDATHVTGDHACRRSQERDCKQGHTLRNQYKMG